MQRRIVIALLLAIAAPVQWVTAQDRQPPSAAAASVIGRYAYRDRELVASLDLRGDHSFAYEVDGVGPPVEGDGPLHLNATGVWRLADSGTIVLTNAPTIAPVFRQVSAVRDPGVRAAFTIVSTDGGSIETLGVRTNDNENGQMKMLSSDGWTIPLHQAWDSDEGKKGSPTRLPRSWDIVRSSDNRTLLKVDLSPGGPNRYVFQYTPSPIEPFQLEAGPVDGEPGTMEVEFGTASITMHRVPSP